MRITKGCLFLLTIGAVLQVASTSTSRRCVETRQRIRLLEVRGGAAAGGDSASFYELNPDYVGPVAVGDKWDSASSVDQKNAMPQPERRPNHFDLSSNVDRGDSSFQPKKIVRLARDYWQTLHKNSPSLTNTLAASGIIFLAWQFPMAQPLLAKHFVCSRRNVHAGRWGVLLLSCISHADPLHLLFNSVALVSFGPRVVKALQWPLWPFLIGAGLSGSGAFLLLDRHQGGGMGLSGITLALLAFDALFKPEGNMTFTLGVIPVRMSAKHTLLVMLAWSIVGMLVPSRSGVAHAAHFGGLLFGCSYYELWNRRVQLSPTIRRMQKWIHWHRTSG
jgi:membrane associated rhomboid family serine protease